MKKDKFKFLILINIFSIIFSIGSIVYVTKNSVQLNNENLYDTKKDDYYVKAETMDSFFIPDLRKDTDIFQISEDNKSLILLNPEKNSCLIKYEIYFKEYNFSIKTDCIPAGETYELSLYDKFSEGTYDILVKMSFWYDENTLWDGTTYLVETSLNVIKNKSHS